MTKLWRIWKYALGSFSDERTKKYDNHVVVVRSIIFLSYLTTNCFIIAGVIHNWWLNMKDEQKTPVGNTNKSVSQCSPSIHTTLLTYIEEKMGHITGSIVERKRKTTSS